MNIILKDIGRFGLPIIVVVITVFGQMILKWQVDRAGSIPSDLSERLHYLARLTINPWVLTYVVLGFVSMLLYALALGSLELGTAFTFITCMTITSVMILAVIFGYETMSVSKAVAMVLILTGIVIMNRRS